MVATPNITRFSQLYDVPSGEGIWTRQGATLIWSPKDAVTWRAPVATSSALPSVGNVIGDVRVALADATVWVFTSTGWIQTAGGSGVGLPPTSVINLVIQNAEPNPAAYTINTLWINVDGAGIPEAVGTWKAYTDATWSGDGGNLFVQRSTPTPSVDSLWVPLDSSYVPLPIGSWVVFTGRGSVAGVGNPNLYISATQPTTPVAGSLWIPLNVDQSAKTPDQWQVNA